MTLYKSPAAWCVFALGLLCAPLMLRAAAPFAITQPATRLSKDASVLNAMAVPNGQPTVAWFELGFRGRYDLQTPAADIEDGSSVVAISAVVSNLLPNTTYQTRLVASNSAGIIYGAPTFFASAASALAWGDNWFSQSAVPTSLDDAVAVAAGERHTLIVRANGKVVGFGDNSYGQSFVPRSLSDVIAVAAGENHSVALKADGAVIVWGANMAGQRNVPGGLRDVIAIAAGDNHTLALRLDGSVVAWGLNDSGQTDVPTGLSNVVAIAAGAAHSVALRADGSVAAWGDDSFGQTRVPTNLNSAVAVAAGGYRTVALRSDGHIVAWGLNASGQFDIPREGAPNNVIAISAGSHHTLAARSDGSLAIGGLSGNGEAAVPDGLKDIIALAGGGAHTVVLANNISEKTRAYAASTTTGASRDALLNLSLAHAGTDPFTLISGKFSHRLALYPTQKPPEAIPQQLTTGANEDLLINLTASSSGAPPGFRITSLPPNAKLYQYAFGTRGPEITPDSLVSDPGHRIIFSPAANGFSFPFSSFNFVATVATNDTVASSPATVTVNVLPPEPPRILAIEPLASGAIQLLIEGHSHTIWSVSASTNLFDWQNLGFATSISPGFFLFTDDNAPQFPNRFYRIGLR